MDKLHTEGEFNQDAQHQIIDALIEREDSEQQEVTDVINKGAIYYTERMSENMHGPQLEGMTTDEAKAALEDPETRVMKLSSPDGEVLWPIFTPLRHNAEYRKQYFGDDFANAYYFSSPFPNEIADKAFHRQLGDHLSELAEKKAIVICDFEENTSHVRDQLNEAARYDGVTIYDTTGSLERNKEPRVIHFSGRAKPTERSAGTALVEGDLNKSFQMGVSSGEFKEFPDTGPTFILPQRITENANGIAESMWAVYEEQFDRLVATHPSEQLQTREDFLHTISDPETVNVGYFEDGEVVGFLSFMDVEKCYWLRPEYYRERYGDAPLVYSPEIVVKRGHEGGNLSISMLSYLANIVNRADYSTQLAFQCTNISAQYVPRLVALGLGRHGAVSFENVETVASYKYDVLRLQKA